MRKKKRAKRALKKEPCDFCSGFLTPRRVEVIRGRGERMVIIEEVPALVCGQCGERYFAGPIVKSVEKLIARGRFDREIQVPVATFEVLT